MLSPLFCGYDHENMVKPINRPIAPSFYDESVAHVWFINEAIFDRCKLDFLLICFEDLTAVLFATTKQIMAR